MARTKTVKWLDRIQAVVEYLIALVFINSGIQLFFLDDIKGDGFLFLLGSHWVLVGYAIWFIFWALALVYSKLRRKKTLHKHCLMALYLTTLYTTILTLSIVGFVDAIDDFIVGLVLAWLWLRWKLKTDYITPRKFYSSVDYFSEDPPPLP